MEIHRQRVTGRMEDREKGQGGGHRWRKKYCGEARKKATGQRQGGRERKNKVAMSRRPEGQGKDRRKDRVTEKTGEGQDARKKDTVKVQQGAGRWDRQQTRATERTAARRSTRENRD